MSEKPASDLDSTSNASPASNTATIPSAQPAATITSGIQAREALSNFDAALAEAYWQRAPIAELMRTRSDFVDAIMRDLWSVHCGETDLALYAVGGYDGTSRHCFPQSHASCCSVSMRGEPLLYKSMRKTYKKA